MSDIQQYCSSYVWGEDEEKYRERKGGWCKFADHEASREADRERIASYETLLRTTVELLDDTDSLILEQLVIDIVCALPPKFIIPLNELDDPEKIQSMIDNAKPDSEGVAHE